MKPYNKSNIPLAKKLRKNMTPWERHLWYDYLRYYPVRFQKQKAIGEYIVDFYCAKAGLVVELDGGGHYESKQMDADRVRTKNLENMNLQVLRICNLDVDRNFAGVCEYIDMAVQKRLSLMRERRAGERESLPQSAALTAPSSEGALECGNRNRFVCALGFFDGVHLGHQALLTACRELAQGHGCGTAAITFDKHPQSLFSDEPPKLLTTLKDRIRLLKQYGMEQVLTLPVTPEVMGTPWEKFLENLLEQGAAGFVCGSDFRFGHKGEGSAEGLKRFCEERSLPCAIVEQQELDGIRISSTHIRDLLANGDMEGAVRMLGHPHVLSGEVVHGRALGRTIGIPTANLLLPNALLCPRYGVYACRAITEKGSFCAVTNIGTRPTVEGSHVTVEPWILDFAGDLYGKELTLEFYAFLRPEQKFGSLEALQAEIQKNAAQTREFFRRN